MTNKAIPETPAMEHDPRRVSVEGVTGRVTAVLITLEEEDNIRDVMYSIYASGIDRVLLVDAGSKDKTVKLARELGAECYVVPKNGMAFQRQEGIKRVATEFTCLIDADCRLEPDCVQKLVRYLTASEFVGVAAQKIGAGGDDYWSKGMTWNNQTALFTLGEKLVVGHPALYYTETLQTVGYDSTIAGPCDDTDLCYRLRKLGMKVGVGPGISRELMRNNFREVTRKQTWYGRGDAEFCLRHPERRWSIATHAFKNYFIKGQFRALMRGRPDLMPYFAVCGLCRTFGFWKGLIELRLLRQQRIYKT